MNTTVTSSDGASSTSVKQGNKDITNTAKQGTITNEAKDLVNKAAENITNTAGNRIQDKVGTTTVTTTDGLTKLTNEAGNHKTQMDYAEVLKDLSVGGSATVAGDVTAKSYKVADKTYIDQNGLNANSQKVTNVADGTIAEGSKDAVNGGQLHATNQRVSTVENRMDGVENRVDRVENRVDNLDNRIDKVGASAAAMANLHPMDFDEDSKVSVAAAVGNYRSETAGALGVFYRPTDRGRRVLQAGQEQQAAGKGGSHQRRPGQTGDESAEPAGCPAGRAEPEPVQGLPGCTGQPLGLRSRKPAGRQRHHPGI